MPNADGKFQGATVPAVPWAPACRYCGEGMVKRDRGELLPAGPVWRCPACRSETPHGDRDSRP